MCAFYKNNTRRGVTLLVVLALMVMFAMLVTAFMVIVTHSRRAVESAAQVRIDPPESKQGSGWEIPGTAHLELAVQHLLTGTVDLDNVIAPHSILENLYGQPLVPLSLTKSDFTLTAEEGLLVLQLTNNSSLLPDIQNNRLGYVITAQFPDSPDNVVNPLHNRSTFVFDIQPSGIIRLAPFRVRDSNEQLLSVEAQVNLLNTTSEEYTLALNAPAFSGTGAGYDFTTPPTNTSNAWLSKTDDDVTPTDGKPLALRPNITAPNSDGSPRYKEYLINNDVRMNPDYTAPDFMTMFLAWNDIKNGKVDNIIPSFHRPQLIKYWQQSRPDDPPPLNDILTELRKYVLRPLPYDHRNFTGSNPAAKWYEDAVNDEDIDIARLEKFLTEGPWDVDNDGNGTEDGIWIDAGLSAEFDTRTLSWYKPLISYYIIDMDGRINVNTLGNLAQFETPYELTDADRTTGSIDHKGTGMGPAELSSELLNKQELLTERYGEDKKPGGTGDSLLLSNGINLDAYTKGGLTADWYGFSQILFDNPGSRRTEVPAETVNPYLMNPYTDTAGDKPFTGDDLEMLLRSVIDLDYNSLSLRLRDLFDTLFDPTKPTFTPPQLRYNFTTRSNDIPASASILPGADGVATIYQRLQTLCDNPDELWMLLPEEIRRSGKVNLNRLILHPYWNGTENDLVQHTEMLKVKARFAQEIYYLLRILVPMDKQTDLGRERLAQWSVNIVDFIDPDDVMTPFIFRKTESDPAKITAFDNAELITKTIEGTLDAETELTGYTLIWGFEKPEVALTETLAFHDRKVADTAVENFTTGGNAQGEGLENRDDDFDQIARPQGSLFVELYRQGNPNRTAYPNNCVVEANGKLDLAKKTGTDGDYVWRIAIGTPTKVTATAPNLFDWQGEDKTKSALEQLMIPDAIGTAKYPQFNQWADTTASMFDYHPDLGMPERFIWFGDTPPTERIANNPVPEQILAIRSFYNLAGMNVELDVNSSLVIAPRLMTQLTNAGQTIDLSTTKTMTAVIPNVKNVNVPDMTNFELNVSEPLPNINGNTLVDGYEIRGILPQDTPFDLPLSQGQDVISGDNPIHRARGTIPCYKTIALQRLTDPNRPHHSVCNPYITVDWNMIDLQVFTTEQRPVGGEEGEDGIDEEIEIAKDDNMCFSSREWKNKTASFSNIWDRTLDVTDDTGAVVPGKAGLQNTGFAQTRGAITTIPRHTLGTPPSALQDNTDPANPLTAPPQLHFPFHDAPLMNSGELMLVPASAPGRFGIEFHDNGTTDNFFGLKDLLLYEGSTTSAENPRFGYCYQNFAYSPYLNWGHDSSAYLQCLFDFVHVPSRFAGTIRNWTADTDPKKPIYRMREPGKLNLNTLTEEGWKTLKNGRDNFPDYDAFRQYRQWTEANNPSEFRPFRSPSGAHFVPPLESNAEGLYDSVTNVTLMGLGDETNKSVLLDKAAANPYTALENVMRLSDVTTTRSNVFAVWITVGYFEVEKFDDYPSFWAVHQTDYQHITSEEMFKAVYPDGCILGAEKGLNDGTLRRHRAFYLIDRSIPVGFRRGEKLNSQDVIIKKTLLD